MNEQLKKSFPGVEVRNVQDLSEAFDAFSKGADKMKQMYSILEKRVVYLTEELEKKNKELEKANRLASLGELAAGVAHEIRNPLGGIELCATMLQRELVDDTSKKELVVHIVEGTKRLNNIVKNLLTFTKETKLIIRDVFLSKLIDETVFLIKGKAESFKIEIIKDESFKDSHIIKADGDQLRQVFLNILLNAVEAMTKGGKLKLGLRKEKSKETSEDFVVINFSDTGEGIEEKNLDKIFQPFFTTKDEGTGLGLAISHKIIEIHGGKIVVDSVKACGTTFSIYLPAKNN